MRWRAKERVTDLRTCRRQGTHGKLQRGSGGCMPARAPSGSDIGVYSYDCILPVQKHYVQRVLHSCHVDGAAGGQEETFTGLQRRPAKQPPKPLPPPFRYADTLTQLGSTRWIDDLHVPHFIVAKNCII